MIKIVSTNWPGFQSTSRPQRSQKMSRIGRRAAGLVQNGMVAAVVRRDFPQINRGKSCSQFAHRLAQPRYGVKLDFLCVFKFGGCYNLKMTTDSELLRQFAQTSSEAAFAELLKRHVNLVYSAALRQVNGDEHFAKDVAQTVFTDLARKAVSLSRRETLTGWLYTSAHFAAAKMVRGENRRRDREEKYMREPTSETALELDWEKIRPALDDAMHELNETDREAILLRYFENRQFIQVGAKLGLNENAARMRVERALEKLRGIFEKSGIATAMALASVISANAVQTAPANLAVALTIASIATAGTGTFTLLKIMTATKLKLAISALVVAGAATAFIIQDQVQEILRAKNDALTQQLAQLQKDNENLSNKLDAVGDSQKLSEKQFNELLKLRGEVGLLRQQTNQITKLKQENQRIYQQIYALRANTGSSQHVSSSPLLYSRHFRINMATFFQNLSHSFPASDGEKPSETFVRFLKQNGVELLNPGESLFVNDQLGELFVRTSETNLDTIENIIEVINSNQ
jgi:RNA polymerase sigma factor (sigma-70 family)